VSIHFGTDPAFGPHLKVAEVEANVEPTLAKLEMATFQLCHKSNLIGLECHIVADGQIGAQI